MAQITQSASSLHLSQESEVQTHEQRAMDWLRKASLRPTVVRLWVTRMLLQGGVPVGAETLFQQMKDSGENPFLASVYRVLKELEQHGYIKREWLGSQVGAKAIYSVNGDRRAMVEYWFACPHCGRRHRITDLTLTHQISSTASLEGYELPREVLIPMICAACR